LDASQLSVRIVSSLLASKNLQGGQLVELRALYQN